ncbi:MAG: glycosyltransferase family 4 protein [Vicinamibacterales bacterium]
MRIAIDARKLHDFGIGTYVRNLLRQLAHLDHDSEYVLLCRPGDLGVATQLGPNFSAVEVSAKPYSMAEQIAVPHVVHGLGVDVFHTPHYVLPPLVAVPSVVTIHDCIHLMFPQYLPNRLAHLYAKMFLWVAAHRSARVLTVSATSKRDILRFFNVPETKIEVIHNAIDDRFGVAPPLDEFTRVRERFQLNRDFILYTGNIKPHKNLERLIDAFHELRLHGFDQLMLLIIGDELSKYPTLRRAVHKHGIHKHVRFLGFVPDQTLAVLYRLAKVFVFPSLYEGFGLPPLEAMASGTPVVTSNISSLPEVAGDAAVLIDPYDVDSIADGLRRALTDESLREELVSRGLARVRDYSWERSVTRVREVYGEVASGV